MLVDLYVDLNKDSQKSVLWNEFKQGLGFGLSQATTYIVMGAIFFFGGLLINITKDDGKDAIKASAVFSSIFPIMFGAFQAASAGSALSDVGKAEAAAIKIYKIVQYPSMINAVKMDEDKTLKSAENMKGVIELKNVWFRYPTRKEDFVLKGLTLKINPNETVALVGESGCGKSTFINLMMRFYDVDFGEILIDGVNIKEYNLHSLRTYISLVM